jgi:hypothetical protein
MTLYAYNQEKAIDKFWQVPHENLHVSTWLCMHSTKPTQGEFLVGIKYLPNKSD